MVYLRQSRYRKCGLRRTLDGNIPHFCFTKNGTLYFAISFTYLGTLHDFFFDTKYKIELYLACFFILCYSDAIPFYIYIHISVRLHSLYNAFFSVSYRPEKNQYNDCNDRNSSFHGEQLPVIAACSGFGWMFSHASTGSLQVKTFTQ